MTDLDRMEEKIRGIHQRVFTRAELFRMIDELRDWKSSITRVPEIGPIFNQKSDPKQG